MRDIAAAAGLSLGASYYYFPTKEAIVMAFYDHVNSEHYERAHAAMQKAKSFRERLAISISTKLEILREDRRLLIALFRYGGDPDHPLSWFGKGTEPQRKQAMAVFREAIGDEKLPPDVRKVAPMLLWTAHMGVILYFLYDKSPGQKKTRALLDEGLDLLVQAFEMSSIAMLQPLLAPTRSKILKLLKDAELLPEEP
jgi:AcrR family transcriptional regulator